MIMLAAFSVVALGIIGYLLKDKFLPQPEGKVDVPAVGERLAIPELGDYQKLFDREDYQAMESFGSVPVSPKAYTPDANPFRDVTGTGGFGE